MNELEKEFEEALKSISDTYPDFVTLVQDPEMTPEIMRKILNYIKINPDATTSDVTDVFDRLIGIPVWNPETEEFEPPDTSDLDNL